MKRIIEYYKGYFAEYKWAKWVLIGVIIIGVFVNVFNVIFWKITGCTLIDAFIIYKYDQSLVWINYTDKPIHDEDYQKGLELLEDGAYEAAEPYMIDAWQTACDQYGTSDLRTAQIEQGLGRLYIQTNKYESGYDYLISAYTSYNETLGLYDEKTILANADLATCAHYKGDNEQALSRFMEVYERTRYYPMKAQTAAWIAIVYGDLSEYESASQWADVFLDYLSVLNGRKFDQSFLRQIVLANQLKGQQCINIGEYQMAKEYLDDALLITSEEFPSMSSDDMPREWIGTVLEVYRSYANMYIELGDAERIQEYGGFVSEFADAYHGDDEISISYDMVSVGAFNLDARETIIRDLESQFGENSQQIANVYFKIASSLEERGLYKEAITYYLQALETRKNLLHSDTEQALIIYEHIADCYYMNEQYEKALDYAVDATKLSEELFSPFHSKTITLYNLLSASYYKTEKVKETVYMCTVSTYICNALDINDIRKENTGKLLLATAEMMDPDEWHRCIVKGKNYYKEIESGETKSVFDLDECFGTY